MREISRFLFLAATIVFSSTPLLQAQESDLLVTKSGPAVSAADTDVSYSVGVQNLGPDDAVSLTLTDAIPGGMTFVSAVQDDGPAFSCATPTAGDSVGSISCTLAILTTGGAANFTFVFHIPPATPPGTFFTNTAHVTSPTDPNSENDSASAGTATPPPPQADLSVMKTGPGGAGPDEDVVYTITLTNAGPDDATTVALNDLLPGTMTFVSLVQNSGPVLSCTTPTAGSGGTVSCTTATFPNGATATFTLTTHVPAGTANGTAFQNKATVSSDDDPNGENDTSATTLDISTADVGVTKTGSTSVTAGTNITYTITVTNSGPDAAQDVTLDDVLPPDTTFVSLTQNTGPPAACVTPSAGANGTISCNMVALANGVSAQFTLVIEAGNTTSASNTATVTTISSDGNTGNDSATAITTVTPSADLSVTKNGPSAAAAGNNLTYTVTLSNNGPSDAASVSLTDTIPANTTFVSETQPTGPAFNCVTPAVGAAGTITCTIATFGVGDTATFSITVAVSPAATDGSSIANTADVSSATPDPNGNNNSSTTTATVASTADVSVTKTGPAAVNAGSDVSYRVTVTNSGPADAASVTLTDILPADTTFVSETQTSGPPFACVTPAVGATGTITCTIGTLPPGTTAAFTIVLHVSTQATGTIANTATVTTPSDPTPGNNASTTNTAIAAVFAGVPTLSPVALALMALALVGIVLVFRT